MLRCVVFVSGTVYIRYLGWFYVRGLVGFFFFFFFLGAGRVGLVAGGEFYAAQLSRPAYSCRRAFGSFEREAYGDGQRRLDWNGMNSPRLKRGRKTGGDCHGVGRGSMVLRIRNRMLVMEPGRDVSPLRSQGSCQIKM